MLPAQLERLAAMKRRELEQAAARWHSSHQDPPAATGTATPDVHAQLPGGAARRALRAWRVRAGEAIALAGARLAGVDGRALGRALAEARLTSTPEQRA